MMKTSAFGFTHLRAGLLTATLLLTVACSSGPAEVASTEKAVEKAPAEAPVTGKTAFWEMYKLAHGWAADLQTLYLKSGELEGVTAKPGEAALWTVMFVSPTKNTAREFTYRAITQGTAHKGVGSGPEQPWGGSVPKAQAFGTADMKLDSNEAYDKATEEAKAYVKANPDKKVSFYLGKESRFPAPVWSVLWGGDKGVSVIVNASDGSIIKR
jgi:hypothetical protein